MSGTFKVSDCRFPVSSFPLAAIDGGGHPDFHGHAFFPINNL
jgi:hypothetical protein